MNTISLDVLNKELANDIISECADLDPNPITSTQVIRLHGYSNDIVTGQTIEVLKMAAPIFSSILTVVLMKYFGKRKITIATKRKTVSIETFSREEVKEFLNILLNDSDKIRISSEKAEEKENNKET